MSSDSGHHHQPQPSIWKGVAAGLAGGLVGTWVMTQFQGQLSKLSPAPEGNGDSGDDATMKTAAALSKSVTGHRLTKKEKAAAGPVVHYAFGSLMGAAYGVVAEGVPQAADGWGLPFGTVLWIGADEVAVPMLGLAGSPAESPVSVHASALASHLVYGLTTDFVRRAVRAAL